MGVRRVVTGHDVRGKSIVASDGPVSPVEPKLLPGLGFHLLWGDDETSRFPNTPERPQGLSYYPPVGGVRFGLVTFPPATERAPLDDASIVAGLAEMEELLPGMLHHADPSDPGMHKTATIDFEVILAGEIDLELDDGVVVHLHVGDTVVQNGTRHRWSNPGSEPAVMAAFFQGAHHEGVE